MKSVRSSVRGRPKIPIQWSRIISFDDIDEGNQRSFEMDKDFKEMNNNPLAPKRSTLKEFELLFDPKECWKELDDKRLESHQLESA